MGAIDIMSMSLLAWGLIVVAKKWKNGEYDHILPR